MRLVAHAPHEVECGQVVARFVLGQQAHVQEVVDAATAGLNRLKRPVGGVVVAQPAGGLLDVGLQQIQGITV